jgi:hypothetical protein
LYHCCFSPCSARTLVAPKAFVFPAIQPSLQRFSRSRDFRE